MSEDNRRASNEYIDKEPLVSVVIPVYNVMVMAEHRTGSCMRTGMCGSN